MNDRSEKPQRSLREIFLEAAEIEEASARAVFLEAACAGDTALRRRLDQLLAAEAAAGPPGERVLDSSSTGGEMVGARVGRYKLLQQIGEGGCGVVFMAEQEEPVRRRVALKVIKLGMDTRQVVARFEAERQALALMEHPNISRVLDAGATDSGRPYFVMELVRGVKITEYCDQHQLATRQRLDLFTQVCQAVQHAHQKGIIHRDLKPSNILVTELDGAPIPKVIDFGIAKAVEGRLTDQTLFTAFEQFLGTPAYMSPEQAAMTAADIDTRSDIYSLGVLLYELITGRTPFDQRELLQAGLDAMRRTIRETEPQRPSTRLSTLAADDLAMVAKARQSEAPRLIPLVRGDLDWIVMKCLEKDRARRYETANGLAMDLQRHLNCEPVFARPPSRLYEFQKTVRRHKLEFAAAAALIAVLAAGVIISAWEAARARHNGQLLRRQSYTADMNLARQALRNGDLGRARDLLRRHVPASGEADLRNWEWRYLANDCQGDPHYALQAHSSEVSNVRFLDDHRLLTTGIADWRTVVWNLRERRPASVLTNHNWGGGVSTVTGLAARRQTLFFRNAWTGSEGVVSLALDSGLEKHFLTAGAAVAGLEVSPDQNFLAVAAGERVELWNLDQQTNQFTLPVEGLAASVAFSPDGHLLVVGDAAGHLDFWDFARRTKVGVLTNETGSISPVKFSGDGRWLVNPGGLAPTRVCRMEDRTWVRDFADTSFVQSAAFSPDGRTLAVVGGDSTVRLWDTATWKRRAGLRGHTDVVLSVEFSPDGHLLATGSRNGEVLVWLLDQPRVVAESATYPQSVFVRVAPDGSGFARVEQAKRVDPRTAQCPEVELWSSKPPKRLGKISTGDLRVREGLLLPGGRTMALGCRDGTVHLRSLGAEKAESMVQAHRGPIESMAVSLDGSTLATVAIEGGPIGVRLWRLPQLGLVGETSMGETVAVKLSEEGKLLAGFTPGTGHACVWQLPLSGKAPLWRAFGAMQDVPAIAFSPDGLRVAAAVDQSGGLFLWDLATHQRLVLARTPTFYSSLSYSRDGTRLAAGSTDGARLFDAATGEEVLSFEMPASALAFLPDGEKLLAVSSDRAVVFRAPPLAEFRDCDWLKESASQEASDYPGPRPSGSKFAPPRDVKAR